MNNGLLNYKGYRAIVQYDEEAQIFHGEVINLRDVVTFQSCSQEALEHEFQKSVEDYLAFKKIPSS